MRSIADRFNDRIRATPRASATAMSALQARIHRDQILQIIDDTEILPRPGFLLASEKASVERDVRQLMDLMMAVPDRLFGGDAAAMCDAIGLGPVERAAVLATWEDREITMGRADLLRDEAGFKLLELNINSATGGLENADLARAMSDIPFFREFMEEEHLAFTDSIDGVAAAMGEAARRRGLGARPTVAVVDWHTTYAQFERRLKRLACLFVEHGFDAFACDVRDLELEGGRLVARGRPVDILYRFFLLDDLRDSPLDLEPILAAHRAGSIILAMGFIAELVGNKATLAFLTDPAHRDRLTADERALVARLIPQTRLLDPELRDLVIERQQDVVLKPVMGFGGYGVLTGWTASKITWEAEVDRILTGPVRYVVQDRVRPLAEEMPRFTPDGARWQRDIVNWGIFLASGCYNGAFIRALGESGPAVINLLQGAAVGTAFHEEADPSGLTVGSPH
jgi:glutathionylspermidine synthase